MSAKYVLPLCGLFIISWCFFFFLVNRGIHFNIIGFIAFSLIFGTFCVSVNTFSPIARPQRNSCMSVFFVKREVTGIWDRTTNVGWLLHCRTLSIPGPWVVNTFKHYCQMSSGWRYCQLRTTGVYFLLF